MPRFYITTEKTVIRAKMVALKLPALIVHVVHRMMQDVKDEAERSFVGWPLL